jgi:UDP-N-acetylmuramate dehydrogenase
VTSIEKNAVNLAPLTTFRVPARARRFTEVRSLDEVRALARQEAGRPILPLGGGSNILFVGDPEELVVANRIRGRRLVAETDASIEIEFGGGENWDDSVRWCVENGWGGIENLILIPGTVGAAPIQNIGAYGAELAEVFVRLTAVEMTTGAVVEFDRAACRFGYRDSLFKQSPRGRFFITAVTLHLAKGASLKIGYADVTRALAESGIDAPTIRDLCAAVERIRRAKLPDPALLGNAGSFFKNPEISLDEHARLKASHPDLPGYPGPDRVKIPAAWLIEKAGWKGRRLGNVSCHERQPLVIVNHGGATGEEILEHAKMIIVSVRERLGIELSPEVNIVGKNLSIP